jgi:hypothetical protein
MGNLIVARILSCSAQSYFGYLCGSCTSSAKNSLFTTRLIYMLIIMIGFFMSWLAYHMTPSFLATLENLGAIDCQDSIVCLGIQASYRLSFTLFFFHTVMLALSLCGGDLLNVVETGCWTLKIGMYLGIFCTSLFIDNSIMVRYR